MNNLTKIINACEGRWRTIGSISRATKIDEKEVAFLILSSIGNFRIDTNLHNETVIKLK